MKYRKKLVLNLIFCIQTPDTIEEYIIYPYVGINNSTQHIVLYN
jgi:hypothetical protein